MRLWRRLYSSLRYTDAVKLTREDGVFILTERLVKHYGLSGASLYPSDLDHQAKQISLKFGRTLELFNEQGQREKVISKGSICRDSYPDAAHHSYILAICATGPDRVGLSWADINDGTIKFQETSMENVGDDLARISPCDIIVEITPEMRPQVVTGDLHQDFTARYPTTYAKFPRIFDENAYALFDSPQSLRYAQDQMSPQASASMAGLLGYIEDTTSHQVKFSVPHKFLEAESMGMDKRARYSLELFASASRATVTGSLFSAIKRTKTQSGTRSLHDLLSSPHRSIDRIRARHGKIEALLRDPFLLARIQAALVGFPDCKLAIQRLLNDTTTHYIYRWALAIEGMKDTLKLIEQSPELDSWTQELRHCLAKTGSLGQKIYSYMHDTSQCPEESKEYRPIFDPAISKPLTDLYRLKSEFEDICAQVLNRYSTRYDNPSIKYNSQLGFHVVIKQEPHPSDIVLRTGKRTTSIRNAELWRAGKTQEQFSTRLRRMEEKLVNKLRDRILELNFVTRSGIDTMDDIDITQSFTKLSQERNLVRPDIVEDPVLDVVEGRHIAVEQLLTLQEGIAYVPNNCKLISPRVCLVTGPNMGGKSTYMRQMATTVILAHIGCFVPAKSASIGIVDKIFCRIGSADDGFRGQSTFLLETLEAAHILRNITSRSLAMLDEIGSGTSKRDGVALAYSAIYYLATHANCRALISTHSGAAISELIKADKLPVSTLHSQNYRMVRGLCSSSRGVELARVADFPPQALDDAKYYLGK